ncbi:MAG: efflux RND transporter permease subunit [Planctomycetota bacterium]|nr:efflux RND transporter permease subunit [Planctomycetota bacterium]
MIIDDSIVVIENTTRHMEAGKGRFEAAILGISEIGFAVIATSLTIAAVFVPVAFMKGLVGRFFFEFGMTVTFAVGMSTFIALTLSPMLCSRVLKLTESNKGIFRFSDWILDKTEILYSRVLGFALRQRTVVILAALLLFILSLGLSGFIGKEFVPAQDESQFNVQVEAPLGSSITRSSRNLRLIEQRLREIPEVTNLYVTLGSGQDGRVNVGKILVQL